ncbi:hypothetical protein BQ8794_240318 [Mesorhizobium prunaredense]|uniref:Uncharacterized protein n=1 Tax=Mesorhizobium prunaredense TaxID=1631249 RepID=A0A1R3V891_9HYPH|nr:hypothetical protein BQ8794_240318 [Mesorhizobium prunaredense]
MTMPRVEVITSVENHRVGHVRKGTAWSRRRSSPTCRCRKLHDRRAFTSASSFEAQGPVRLPRCRFIDFGPDQRAARSSRKCCRRHRRLSAAVAGKAASSKSSFAPGAASASVATWMSRRCGARWTRSGHDDPGSERRAGVAGDRLYRHEDGLPGLALVVQEKLKRPSGPGTAACRAPSSEIASRSAQRSRWCERRQVEALRAAGNCHGIGRSSASEGS